MPTARLTCPSPRPAPQAPTVPPAERYRDRLLRYVSRLTAGDPHRAEDIVQETMLRAWLAAERGAAQRTEPSHEQQNEQPAQQPVQQDGEQNDRLAAWLHTVARNLAVDAHRRDRTLPTGIVPPVLARRADDGGDLAERVADRMLLISTLARLTPEHREILCHVHLCDRSRAEAAHDLGIPQGTVKSRVHYALSALRREIPAA